MRSIGSSSTAEMPAPASPSVRAGVGLLGRWYDVNAYCLGAPREGRVGILFNDVSGRRNAEDALRELNKTLEDGSRRPSPSARPPRRRCGRARRWRPWASSPAASRTTSTTCWRRSSGSLDLLGRRIGGRGRSARRYVDAAIEGARRAATLTQRLLAFSRQQPLRPEALDVNRLVQGMRNCSRRRWGRGSRSRRCWPGALAGAGRPQPARERDPEPGVNARDAMPDGGRLTIETANAISTGATRRDHPGLRAGQYVRIAVTDTGDGMSAEVLARAFDPSSPPRRSGKGTGLGLSQVYGFVKQSGGHVKIYSSRAGTTVRIYLPRLGDAAPAAGRRRPAICPGRGAGGRPGRRGRGRVRALRSRRCGSSATGCWRRRTARRRCASWTRIRRSTCCSPTS